MARRLRGFLARLMLTPEEQYALTIGRRFARAHAYAHELSDAFKRGDIAAQDQAEKALSDLGVRVTYRDTTCEEDTR